MGLSQYGYPIRECIPQIAEMESKIIELEDEVARHNEDFKRISKICEELTQGGFSYEEAFMAIRNIVG